MVHIHLPHTSSWYIRHGYGTWAIRNKREAKALYDFCKKEIEEQAAHGPLSPSYQKRLHAIYRNTIDMYHHSLRPENVHTDFIKCECGTCTSAFIPWDFYHYANEHACWYWN